MHLPNRPHRARCHWSHKNQNSQRDIVGVGGNLHTLLPSHTPGHHPPHSRSKETPLRQSATRIISRVGNTITNARGVSYITNIADFVVGTVGAFVTRPAGTGVIVAEGDAFGVYVAVAVVFTAGF